MQIDYHSTEEEVLTAFQENGEMTLIETKVAVARKRLGYNDFTAEAYMLVGYLNHSIDEIVSDLRRNGKIAFNKNKKYQLT